MLQTDQFGTKMKGPKNNDKDIKAGLQPIFASQGY